MSAGQTEQSAFAFWARTGRMPRVRSRDGRELKYNRWHDPDDGRFTFANSGMFVPRGGGGSARSSSGPLARSPAEAAEPMADDIVVVAQRQTVDDVGILSDDEFDAFERAAKARRWTSARENREIHQFARLKRARLRRAAIEKAGEKDWAQQGKDFARLYAEQAVAEAAGAAVGKFVVAPAIRRAAPMVERVVRPKAYARKLAERTPRPPAPKPTWLDETVSMKPRARAYNDSAPGARSNPVTKRSQAPALYRTTADGKRRPVRFDGYEDGAYPVFIDRKTGISFKSDAKDQAIRQSMVLRENNAIGRWDVPDAKTKERALKLFRMLKIDNIGVKVFPE